VTVDVVRVLVVDDHPTFRDGLRAVLTADDGCALVGEAATGTEGVELARALNPDVVAMDLWLPGMSGVEAIRTIAAQHPAVAVLALTSANDDGAVVAAVRAGARGYLAKDAGRREIIQAIHAVAAGQVVMGASVADQVLARLGGEVPAGDQALPVLTPREREVLQLLVDGAGTTEVARTLGLAHKTVRNQVSAILTKLQVADRAAAAARARTLGIYPSGR
jgi:DNA-binding NarL/FixJ family response regulator